MDPYLEAPDFWSDVRAALIPLIRASLTPFLPAGYAAKIDQYVWLQDVDEERIRHGKPDVFLTNGPGRAEEIHQTANTHGITVTLPATRKRKSSRFVSIVDNRRNKVITVIELLSPSNKAGDEREMYLSKRSEYLASGVNLVEIDLLRSGARPPMGKPEPAAGITISLFAGLRNIPRLRYGRSPCGNRFRNFRCLSGKMMGMSYSTSVPVWTALTMRQAMPHRSIMPYPPLLLSD
jgi:hypothetical protein